MEKGPRKAHPYVLVGLRIRKKCLALVYLAGITLPTFAKIPLSAFMLSLERKEKKIAEYAPKC